MRCPVAFVVVAVVAFAAIARTENGSAAALYSAALSRERALRTPTEETPALSDLRNTIAAYETILRQFPTTDYGDHALWQAAGLALDAFDYYRQQQDLDTGIRLLETLSRQYPSSSLAARAEEYRRRFGTLAQLVWLNDIEREVRGNVVRVTAYLDGEVRFHSERLEHPSRLFFDLRGTEAAPPLRNTTLTFDGDLVREIRLGRHPNHVTRLVLHTEGAEHCSTFTLYDPFRIVTDCHRTFADEREDQPEPVASQVTDAASLALPPLTPTRDPPEPLSFPVATANTNVSLARQLGLNISRIVIDAGHGGYDPGAHVPGLEEADLVLDIAQRLEQQLSTYPIEVVLTRRNDDYIPLEARTALANRVDADLFLSIHANASHHADTRGVATYFLNFTKDPAAQELALRENATSLGTMGQLEDMLGTIAANNKVNESRNFAELVQSSMVKQLRRADAEIPDLGVKRAPFVVLIGARMPGVLAEISFITNRQDATLLSTEVYRDLITDALLEAILSYRQSLKHAPLAASRAAVTSG